MSLYGLLWGSLYSFICRWCLYLTGYTPMGLHGMLRDSFTFLYVDYVSTSQATHLWASTTCYGDRFTILYVGDIRTSQATHLWGLHGLYGDSV
jgi:hypothetical protein